jgi:predicted O-methyltransferase YrrM
MSVSLDFCPTLAELYRTGGAEDASGVRREAHGLSTPNNIRIIRALMMERKPERTIEIGLAAGGSALAFAASHRDLGQEPCRQHVAIDPYQRAWHHLGKTLVTRAELGSFVEVIEQLSCLALPDKMRASERFQLAYIDGSHAFHEALLDFYYVRHLLDMGGIVVFDDCSTRDIRMLIRFIRTHMVSFKEFSLWHFHHLPRWKYTIAKHLDRLQCRAFIKVAAPQKDESWQWE